MMGISSGCGLCPWSCSGKVGAYAGSGARFSGYIMIFIHNE